MRIMIYKKNFAAAILPSRISGLSLAIVGVLVLLVSSVDCSSSSSGSSINKNNSPGSWNATTTRRRRRTMDDPFLGEDPNNDEPTATSTTSTTTTTSTAATTAAATTPHAATTSSDVCPLKCAHGTACVRGDGMDIHSSSVPHPMHLDMHKEKSRDGWYCACTDGYTGIECKYKHKTCNGVKHVCYNGGECIDDLEAEQLYCNCQPQADPATGATHYYSGTYCQVEIPAPATTTNTKTTTPATTPTTTTTTTTNNNHNNNMNCRNNPDFYCKNGGVCKTNAPDMDVDPCVCPNGYEGKHCEYETHKVPGCKLQCQNGGSCRYGIKTVNPVLGKFEDPHVDYQHCECPAGYTGNFCETKKDDCGDFVCLHGSQCLTSDKSKAKNNNNNNDQKDVKHYCDCRTSDKPSKFFAGRHCEYQSTSICTYGDDKNTTAASSSAIHYSHTMFCTNNGTCPSEEHHVCNCPRGYSGAHCEFLQAEIEREKEAHAYQCQLECHNGGTCRKGVKGQPGGNPNNNKYYNSNEITEELLHMNVTLAHNGNFEYCSCPHGTVGLLCEHEYVTCEESLAKAEMEAYYGHGGGGLGHNGLGHGGDPHLPMDIPTDLLPYEHYGDPFEHHGDPFKHPRDHPCFHGSQCTMKHGKPFCDCDGAKKPPPHHLTKNSSKAFAAAGKYCQYTNYHKDSSSCHFSSTSSEFKGFCANGGVCIENYDIADQDHKVTEHATCDCKNGFTGVHCEINEKNQNSSSSGSGSEISNEITTMARDHDEEKKRQEELAATASASEIMGEKSFSKTYTAALVVGSLATGALLVVAVYETKKRRTTAHKQDMLSGLENDNRPSYNDVPTPPPSSSFNLNYNPHSIPNHTLGLEDVAISTDTTSEQLEMTSMQGQRNVAMVTTKEFV